MKIVYLSTPLGDSYGGGEKFIEGLIDRRPEHEHVFVGRHPSLLKAFQKRGREAHDVFAGFEPVTARNVLLSPLSYATGGLEYARHKRIFDSADVVVAALSYTELFFVVPWIRLLSHKPAVFLIHNRCPRIYLTPLVFQLRHLWNRCPSVFISQTQLDAFREKGMTGTRSLLIPMGVDLHPFSPAERSRERVTLGFLGRLHEEKGLDVFLRALALLETERPLEILLGGEGAALEPAKALAASLGLERKHTLRWLGFVSDTRAFYEKLDLFVFPTRRESFGKVLAEAWERGVPVLSSDIPVLREIKAHAPEAERELTFRSEDPHDLAARLNHFLANLEAFRTRGFQQSLHELVETKLSAAKMYDAHYELFERVAAEARR